MHKSDWRSFKDQTGVVLVIFELPKCATASGSKRERRDAEKSLYILEDALRLNPTCVACLMGPRSSTAWTLPNIAQWVHQPGHFYSEHQWCGLGCCSNNGTPLRAITSIHSTKQLPWTSCKCAPATTHVAAALLRSQRHNGQGNTDIWLHNLQLWSQHITTLLCNALDKPQDEVLAADTALPATRADSTTAVTSTAFPTESRMLQKVKEKAEKERTGVSTSKSKRKTPMLCDKHMDDCGTDLKGIDVNLADYGVFDADSSVEFLDEDFPYREFLCRLTYPMSTPSTLAWSVSDGLFHVLPDFCDSARR